MGGGCFFCFGQSVGGAKWVIAVTGRSEVKKVDVSLDEALGKLWKLASGMKGVEEVPLQRACGRILGQDVMARLNEPYQDRAAWDGYAVSSKARPGELLFNMGEVHPGQRMEGKLGPGQCMKVYSGAVLPKGACAVVEGEVMDSGWVKIDREIVKGRGVRKKGAFWRKGAVLLQAGAGIGVRESGLLSAAGYPVVRVMRAPAVCHLAMGSELVETGAPLQPWQVWDSDGALIRGVVSDGGGRLLHYGRVKDSSRSISRACETVHRLGSSSRGIGPTAGEGNEGWQVLVLTGNSSAGTTQRDFFSSLGMKVLFSRVRIKPGGPVVLAVGNGRIGLGMAGNPLSCAVTARFLLYRALVWMQGGERRFDEGFEALLIGETEVGTSERPEVWAGVEKEGRVRLIQRRGTGDLGCLVGANVLTLVPPRQKSLEKGTKLKCFGFPE